MRRALLAVYVAVGALGVVLVLSSVIVELFFRRSERTAAPTPADLLACNRDVERLLGSLGESAGRLHGEALSGDDAVLRSRWHEFDRAWQRDWQQVNERCGFDELADTGLGTAYDRMAQVHRALPRMKLKVRELIERFDAELAEDVTEMRRALDRSHDDLERSGLAAP